MRENPEPNCETRTRGNIEEGDGTLIPNQVALDGGIALTIAHSLKFGIGVARFLPRITNRTNR